MTPSEQIRALEDLARSIIEPVSQDVIKWYYTPMMLAFSRSLSSICTVYDCMDELSHFRFAPAELKTLEAELFSLADVVFTGGFALYEAKRGLHANIHPFPSSVDRAHFATARSRLPDPEDQAALPHPRLGYFGVVDERVDLDLLATLAETHPEWSLVIVGPVVKIDPATLPRRPNIFYLGMKAYDDLPAYLSGWDVALMPFAINDSTKFISPTKTPEYLAGGRPVVLNGDRRCREALRRPLWRRDRVFGDGVRRRMRTGAVIGARLDQSGRRGAGGIVMGKYLRGNAAALARGGDGQGEWQVAIPRRSRDRRQEPRALL